MKLSDITTAMQNRTAITINGVTGLVRGLDMEDGSGNNYNVRLLTSKGVATVFVRVVG